MPVIKKVHTVLFCLLLLISLYTVWQVQYFATGDGACHLHNALVWKDMLFYKQNFYQSFYKLNPNIIPNYFSHAVLALLTSFFTPAVSDKLLISIYILLFVFGYRYFLKQLSIKNDGLTLLIFVFVFQVFLFKGFYNYIFSIAFYFLIFGYYIKHQDQLSLKYFVAIVLASVFLFFVHILGFALFCLSVGFFFLQKNGFMLLQASQWKKFIKKSLVHVALFVPGILLYLNYAQTQNKTNWFSEMNIQEWILQLTKISSITSLLRREINLAQGLFVLLFIMLVFTLFSILLSKSKVQYANAIIALILFSAGVYFLMNNDALGGELLKTRFQIILLLFVISLVALISIPKYIEGLLILISAVFSFSFIGLKIHPIKKANNAIQEIILAENYIVDHSFILPLSFHHEGVFNNQLISENVKIMQNHTASFLQQDKKLIFADNYEATTNYFPLMWKPALNPFIYLGGLESEPPNISLKLYPKPFDYILIFNLWSEDKLSKPYLELINQLKSDFMLTYSNPNQTVLLYKNTKSLSKKLKDS